MTYTLRNVSRESYTPQQNKPLTGETRKGINGNRMGKQLLPACKHCKCQRYTPCGCEGAVKERQQKDSATA